MCVCVCVRVCKCAKLVVSGESRYVIKNTTNTKKHSNRDEFAGNVPSPPVLCRCCNRHRKAGGLDEPPFVVRQGGAQRLTGPNNSHKRESWWGINEIIAIREREQDKGRLCSVCCCVGRTKLSRIESPAQGYPWPRAGQAPQRRLLLPTASQPQQQQGGV